MMFVSIWVMIVLVLGALSLCLFAERRKRRRIESDCKKIDAAYEITKQWLVNSIAGKSTASYFYDHPENKTIAIYGAGINGEMFYDEMKKSGLNIQYFIDKWADSLYYGIDDVEIYNIEDFLKLPPPDVIVITPLSYLQEIIDTMRSLKVKSEIVSLADIIYYSE